LHGESGCNIKPSVLGDWIGEIVGEAVFGRLGRSQRAQQLARLFFGLLGAGLGIAGAIHFAGRRELASNIPMWTSMIAIFVALASFSLFNVGLGRPWGWPAKLFLVSFVSLFLTRVLFGP
jgi:hypothetical protein